MKDETLTTAEAARLLGVSLNHVIRLCDAGLLRHWKVGRILRLRRSDVVRLARESGVPLDEDYVNHGGGI